MMMGSARDILLTALAPLMWGSTYLVTTTFLPPDRSLMAALLRALPAGVLLVLAARVWPRRGEWRRMAVLSALNIGFFQALLFVAAYRLPGGLAAVLGACQPLLILALAWGVDGRRPPWVGVAAALAGMAGMAAMLLSPEAAWDGIGVSAALAAAFSMALGTFLARRWRSDMALLGFTGWQLLLGGLMLVPAALLTEPPLPPLAASAWAAYAYLSLAGALLAYVLWFRGSARLSPVALSSLGLLSPVNAVLLGWGFLGQAPGAVALGGMAAVLASVFVLQVSSAR